MLQQVWNKDQKYRENLSKHYKQVRERLMGKPPEKVMKIPINHEKKVEEVKVIKIVGPKTKANIMIHHIAAAAGMTRDEVFSISRKKRIVVVRYRIWTELRKLGLSLPQISRICRPDQPYDHTTILNGIRKYPKYVQKPNEGEPDNAAERDPLHLADATRLEAVQSDQ